MTAPGGTVPSGRTGASVQVGISVHDILLTAGPGGRRALLARAEQAGLDYLCVADHVSFHDGTGFDGLISATAALTSTEHMPVLVGIYLLALRHPLLTARQLASISQLAPGRLILGVGAGGEDRAEISNSGVDPATRGRRLDECLEILRALAGGAATDHSGEFFSLRHAVIRPAPQPEVPIVVGGRGEAAVRRTARYGDGWLGIFCSPRRYAQMREQISAAAAGLGREPPAWYGLNIWCGLDDDPDRARQLLARELESLYRLPYDKFRHVTVAGNPARVAAEIAPFVFAGARHITVVPVSASAEAAIEHAAAVRAALLDATPGRSGLPAGERRPT
jgi:alkanesulfonate monooxygenase SsuD/methylene tetrahydromethanopterin reductase-like flavin-dependent oxidoreductase (luciferase family)